MFVVYESDVYSATDLDNPGEIVFESEIKNECFDWMEEHEDDALMFGFLHRVGKKEN